MKHTEKRLKELGIVLEQAVKVSIGHFQSAYAAEAGESQHTTYLEGHLAHLFLFDYIANAAEVPQGFRQQFLEKQFNTIEQASLHHIQGEDRLKTVENRFNAYAELPMHNEKHWHTKFIKAFAENLKGSLQHERMQPDYDAVTVTEDEAFGDFLKSEQEHFAQLQYVVEQVAKHGKRAKKAFQEFEQQQDKNTKPAWLRWLTKSG